MYDENIESCRGAWGYEVDSKEFVDQIRGRKNHKAVIETGIKDKEAFLKSIAKTIIKFEDPTGHNCSNDVSAEITLDFGKPNEETYSFNGERFVKQGE